MVDEERLGIMIKAAEFDAHEATRCRPMMQYSRGDYIALQMLASFLTGTVTYVLILVLKYLPDAEDIINQLNSLDLLGSAKRLLLYYVIFLAVYLGITYAVYHIRYTRGRRRVKRYYRRIKKLDQMYMREDHLKS